MKEYKPAYTVDIPQSLRKEHSKALDDISRRFETVFEIHDKGGASCFPRTLAFTHPELAEKYRLDVPVFNLMLYAAAQEVAELSGEKFERDYFGKDDSLAKPFDKPFNKSDLEHFLEGAKSVWFGTVDHQFSDKNDEDDEENGYNHIIGIVPFKSPFSPRTYMIEDTSGQIDFEPQTLEELYESIQNLPVGDNYLQSVFAFRERKSKKPQRDKDKDLFFFTP